MVRRRQRMMYYHELKSFQPCVLQALGSTNSFLTVAVEQKRLSFKLLKLTVVSSKLFAVNDNTKSAMPMTSLCFFLLSDVSGFNSALSISLQSFSVFLDVSLIHDTSVSDCVAKRDFFASPKPSAKIFLGHQSRTQKELRGGGGRCLKTHETIP